MINLLFFTYANKAYDLFALPYAYFALASNPNSKIEIILEDAKDFQNKYESGIRTLNVIYPDKVIFRQSKTVKENIRCKPHVVRFIEQPITKSEYIYIGDIDVMIFENVYDIHKSYIEKNNIPFSNIIRTGTENTPFPRLTGLHFCPVRLMYPLPDISDLDLKARNDENILYEIMNRKGVMVPTSFRNRPICGIHISLNRDSMGRYSVNRDDEFLVGDTFKWGIDKYTNKFIMALSKPDFCNIFFNFCLEFRSLLMVIESVARGEERKLHRISSSFLVDKRLMTSIKQGKRKYLLDKAKKLSDDGKNQQALELLHNINNIWPYDIATYIALSISYFEFKDDDMGVECLLHAKELTNYPIHKRMMNNVIQKYNDKIVAHKFAEEILSIGNI